MKYHIAKSTNGYWIYMICGTAVKQDSGRKIVYTGMCKQCLEFAERAIARNKKAPIEIEA